MQVERILPQGDSMARNELFGRSNRFDFQQLAPAFGINMQVGPELAILNQRVKQFRCLKYANGAAMHTYIRKYFGDVTVVPFLFSLPLL